MRDFIDIVESRVIDGYITGVSSSELIALVLNKGDLRGVGHENKIYLAPAYTNLHFDIRAGLGLPLNRHDPNTDLELENYGFDFYVASVKSVDAKEKVNDLKGRDDWVGNAPNIIIDDLGIWVDDVPRAMANRQFQRMIR